MWRSEVEMESMEENTRVKEWESPAERLDKLAKELKRKRSLQRIRGIVSDILVCKPSDLQDFSFNVGAHKFRGVLYSKRNSLMGTLIYLWDNRPGILRGYPKIKYSEDSRLLGKEVIAQEKVDGTNLLLWRFPDGTIGGKTRLTSYWKGNKSFFYKQETWEDLLKKADNGETYPKIKKLLEDMNVTVCGELYGSELAHDFVHYKFPPIGFKVFDIIDRETMRFLPPLKALKIADDYGIPRVEVRWQGILTKKEVERIEFELSKSLDVEEGWVAKAYFPEENDCYFCKLKCQSVKELCWETSHKEGIPRIIIRKAIRKVLENYPEDNTIESMEPHVIEELREEVEQSLIDKSIDRIREQIRYTLVPNDETLFKLVIEKMTELKQKGLDLTDKKSVLHNLANELGNINGSKIYFLYLQSLKKLEQEK